MEEEKVPPVILSRKKKGILRRLVGENVDRFLGAVSPAYCDNNAVTFRETYGCNFKEAQDAVKILILKLRY